MRSEMFTISHSQQVINWTHKGQGMHICVSKLTIIGSDNGQCQAIIWTNVGISWLWPP